MKVLLIRPYFEVLKRKLGFLYFEPLGLLYIQSVLLSKGHEVEIYDCLAEHPEKTRYAQERDIYHCGSEEKDIVKKIKKFKPDVVGIAGMVFDGKIPFFRTAKLVKQVSSKILVVGGGVFPSLQKEEILRESKNIDIVIVGEGEETMADLLNNLSNLSKVKGICFRDKKGRIIATPSRGFKANLDEFLPPRRNFSKIFNYSKQSGYGWSDKFSFEKYTKRFIYYRLLFLPVIRNLVAKIYNYLHRNEPTAVLMPNALMSTTRGCPNRCSFCSVHKFWEGFYRTRSAEDVIKEIDLLVKNGVKEICIVDENFTVSRERTIKICKWIIDNGYKVKLSSLSGFYLLSLDKEVLEYLYRAGLEVLHFSIENGDQDFLNNVIKKNVDLERAKEVIKQANEIGLYTVAYFIFGHTGETKEIMLKTLKYAFESGIKLPHFSILQLFPGTEVYQEAVNAGIVDKSFDVFKTKTCIEIPVVETKDFTKEDVKKIYNLAYDIIRKGNYEEIKDKIPEILGWE